MRTKIIYGLGLLVLLFSSISTASSFFTILEKSENSVVLEWNSPELNWQSVSIENRSYVIPDLGLPLTQQAGQPQLPFDAITFEHLGTQLVISVLDSVFERITVPAICPAPVFSIDPDNPHSHYLEDPSVYQRNIFSPAGFLHSQNVFLSGHQFIRLQINPIKYNPVTGEVFALRYFRCRVSSNGVGERDLNLSDIDDNLKKMTAGQLGQSRVRTSLKKMSSSFSTEERVKLYTLEEGVYKISGRELSEQGVSIGAVDPQQIKITNRGMEIACLVTGADDGILHETDEIQFYAERLRGENDYYYAYTDTNIYWLHWDSGIGQRFRAVDSPEPATLATFFPHRLHFEKDLEYYQGDSNNDIQDSRVVPGEGWVWDKTIDPGEKFQTTFDVPNRMRDQAKAELRLRVRGETKDNEPNAHHLRVSINGEVLLDTFFDDREEVLPTIEFDSDILLDSGNVLMLESVQQTNRVSRFFFDWFEISYAKRLTAADGWLRVDSLDARDGFHVDGFSEPDVTIWDIGTRQHIVPFNSGAAWTAKLRVESAGILDGNFSRFYINDKQVYSGSRGIAIVALDATDGHILFNRTFDTFASPVNSDSLVLLLNTLPSGAILLAGVSDDGANNLTASARSALEVFGSAQIAELAYRHSWAFIGRKGDTAALAENRAAPTEGSVTASASLNFSSGDSSFNVKFLPESKYGPFVIFESAGLKSPLKIQWHTSNPALAVSGADYLIVTDEKFKAEVQRLADYRANFNGFISAVVQVQDIYDALSHGIENPAIIQTYLQNASADWSPKPRFVLLFGDASWDVKNNLRVTFSNYVPSLGNPVSDALLVCFDGEEDFIPDVSIGRIPVKTVSEARASVDKIINYESSPAARWKKRFVFINGGLDESEQNLFQRQSTALAGEFVDAYPMYGEPVHINKDAEDAQADARSLILDAINNGTIWTNFIGHAASRTWELMFNNPDIDDLSNQGRYPFISSMTCHTGRFAEPTQDSFGEKFLLVPNKGAIGFWGTSGWGYSYEDYLYLRQLYPTVMRDSVRYLGDIITLTKFGLWSRYGAGAHIRNLILQYNLMGDPALSLDLPTLPDVTMEPQDIVVNPQAPSEADSTATIKLRLQNWGPVAQDSVIVDVDIEQLVTKRQVKKRLALPSLGRIDSLNVEWPLRHMAGPVEIRVTLDPDNRIKEDDETNNVQLKQVTVLTSTFAQVAPLNNSLVPLESVTLKIQTPQQYFDESTFYIFEMDTSRSFASSALKVSPPIQAHPLLIKWRPNGLLPDAKYFWRVRLQDGAANTSFVGSFYTNDRPDFGWQQADQNAAGFNVRENVEWTTASRLSTKPITVLLQSAWTNSVGFAVIEVNGQSPIQTGRGVNVVVLNQNSGEVLQTGHFDTYASAAQAAALMDFIYAVPPGRIVLAAVSDEGSLNLTDDARAALESIGSAKIRDLEYRDMWAIIGKKGAAPGSVIEGFEPAKANGAVVLKDTLSVVHTSGRMLSERIGPATRWHAANVDVIIPDSCDFSLNVFGYHKTSGDTVRVLSQQKNATIDLSAIDPAQFPFLYLDAHFKSNSSSHSPLLKSWSILYDPAPDLTISRQLVAQSADTVLVGQMVTFYLDIYNVGLTMAKKVPLAVTQVNQTGENKIVDVLIDSIVVDRYAPIEFTWRSGAVPGEKNIAITVDPENIFDELSEANNSVITSVFVHPDTVRPEIKVTFDDREIFDGDLVSAQPFIRATLLDNNPELRVDSTSIKVFLDGRLLSTNDESVITLQESTNHDAVAELHIRPTLDDGRHILEIQFTDNSLNTVTKRINFTVESDLAIRNVLNYPNPFENDTEFCFDLTRGADIRIKIFTVAGRLIQTIEAGRIDVGYSRIYWDGRDSSGERLANGVYLYQIIAHDDTESSTVSSKVIVMR